MDRRLDAGAGRGNEGIEAGPQTADLPSFLPSQSLHCLQACSLTHSKPDRKVHWCGITSCGTDSTSTTTTTRVHDTTHVQQRVSVFPLLLSTHIPHPHPTHPPTHPHPTHPPTHPHPATYPNALNGIPDILTDD